MQKNLTIPRLAWPSAGCVFAVLMTISVFTTASAHADSNIDPQNSGERYGWTSNGGWINLQGDVTNGVSVGLNYLQGFAWHENFGWINFGNGSPVSNKYSNNSPTDFGVNIDSLGNLTGYAWGENIGWISFDTSAGGGAQSSIDLATGRFKGYAWGENVGWLSFETISPAHVATIPGHAHAENWNLY